MEKMKKKRLRSSTMELANVTKNNVKDIATINFHFWQMQNSDEVTLDGKKVDKIELATWQLFGVKDKLLKLEYNKEKGGLLLSLPEFIREQKIKYEPFQKYLSEKTISQLDETESSIFNRLNIYLDYINSLESKPQPIEEKSNNIHQPHDPNLWNKEAYELFKYLYDNYYLNGRNTKVKLASIWHYLSDYKNSDRIKEPKYILHATKDQYTEFIKTSYGIEITNMDKKSSYHSIHKPIIAERLEIYENSLSKL